MNDRRAAERRTTGTARLVLLLLTATLCAATAGCRSPLNLFGRNLSNDETTLQMADAGDVHGPLERSLLAMRREQPHPGGQSLSTAEGRNEYLAAEGFFKQERYKEAEKAAKKVAKKYKDSAVREDALFLIAEAQFHQKKYSWAQDSYDRLLNEFKSTRYLDQCSRRLFTIARFWLQEPEYVTTDDVQPAGFDDSGRAVAPVARVEEKPRGWVAPSRRVPILPNFWDRTRPVFDTEGRALQALKSIWLKDPTGPLADDALMLTAGHHLRNGNYLEADHLYTILREEYPKSQYAENAYVLGSHVKLASYQGAQYDGKTLKESEQLKQSTLQLYPDHPEQGRLKDELRKIQEAKAGQDWAMVEFYRRKGNEKAMAVYCREILRRYPTTSVADRARQVLNELEPHGRAGEGVEVRRNETPPDELPRPPVQDSRHEDPGRARL